MAKKNYRLKLLITFLNLGLILSFNKVKAMNNNNPEYFPTPMINDSIDLNNLNDKKDKKIDNDVYSDMFQLEEYLKIIKTCLKTTKISINQLRNIILQTFNYLNDHFEKTIKFNKFIKSNLLLNELNNQLTEKIKLFNNVLNSTFQIQKTELEIPTQEIWQILKTMQFTYKNIQDEKNFKKDKNLILPAPLILSQSFSNSNLTPNGIITYEENEKDIKNLTEVLTELKNTNKKITEFLSDIIILNKEEKFLNLLNSIKQTSLKILNLYTSRLIITFNEYHIINNLKLECELKIKEIKSYIKDMSEKNIWNFESENTANKLNEILQKCHDFYQKIEPVISEDLNNHKKYCEELKLNQNLEAGKKLENEINVDDNNNKNPNINNKQKEEKEINIINEKNDVEINVDNKNKNPDINNNQKEKQEINIINEKIEINADNNKNKNPEINNNQKEEKEINIINEKNDIEITNLADPNPLRDTMYYNEIFENIQSAIAHLRILYKTKQTDKINNIDKNIILVTKKIQSSIEESKKLNLEIRNYETNENTITLILKRILELLPKTEKELSDLNSESCEAIVRFLYISSEELKKIINKNNDNKPSDFIKNLIEKNPKNKQFINNIMEKILEQIEELIKNYQNMHCEINGIRNVHNDYNQLDQNFIDGFYTILKNFNIINDALNQFNARINQRNTNNEKNFYSINEFQNIIETQYISKLKQFVDFLKANKCKLAIKFYANIEPMLHEDYEITKKDEKTIQSTFKQLCTSFKDEITKSNLKIPSNAANVKQKKRFIDDCLSPIILEYLKQVKPAYAIINDFFNNGHGQKLENICQSYLNEIKTLEK